MGNLLLTFPDLAPQDFRPWVNEDDARERGALARRLRREDRGRLEGGARVAGHRPGADRAPCARPPSSTIYTPGSQAGVPLNIVGSLQAPPLSWETEAETLRDEIEGTVMSLLGLVGIEADPLASREHVLLSNLVETRLAGGAETSTWRR